jgi:trigger factor
MNVTTERLEDCQVKIIIELDDAEADKRLRQTARRISRQFNIPGYRRGRAPFHAVVRVFGREAIQQEALDDFGNELYEQALEEIEYKPYEVGELQDVEWDPFRMSVSLPVLPEVDLGDYRSVRAPFEVEPVTDDQVGEYLTEVQQANAQWVPAERPAALGDQVVLDMEGKVGDEELPGTKDHELLLEEGATEPWPGFHEEIVGLSSGEEETFTLSVPDEDTENREATFTVRVHTVKEQHLPPLDDDLAMMVGDYETLDELKVSVRESLESEALQRAESEYLEKALDAFVDAATKIEYPPQAIDREAELSLSQMERNLAASGIQLDTYLGMIGKSREMYKEELRPAAEERLKKRLLLNELSEREGLQVDPEEVEAEIERMRQMMGPQADDMMEMLTSPEGRIMVASDLVTARAQEQAVAIAKGEAPPLEEEEGAEIQAEETPENEKPAAEVSADAQAEEEPLTDGGTELPVEDGAESQLEDGQPQTKDEEPSPDASTRVDEQETAGEPGEGATS